MLECRLYITIGQAGHHAFVIHILSLQGNKDQEVSLHVRRKRLSYDPGHRAENIMRDEGRRT